MSGVTHFYDEHPINYDQVVHNMQERFGTLGSWTENELKEFDNDHYGGVQALELLARKAGIRASDHVLDVGCGIGGPARVLAHNLGCKTTGLDITESRCEAAKKLTSMVGLADKVDFKVGDARNMPFPDAMFSVVIGQEAWSHIDDKSALISECSRVLRPKGVLAFTDITEIGRLSPSERERLSSDSHMPHFGTPDLYRRLMERHDMTVLSEEDLSDAWCQILVKRLDMYKNLEATTVQKFGRRHHDGFVKMYRFFVSMFTGGKLGGHRFVAVRQ